MDWKLTKGRLIGVALTLFLLHGVLLTVHHFLRSKVYGLNAAFGAVLINEMGGAVASACLFGFFLYLASLRPVRPANLKAWALVHAAAIVTYSLLHTTAHLAIRRAFYPWFGFGPFNPGNVWLRYAMELPNDVVSYSKWGILFLAFQYYRRLRDREMGAAALEHSLAEAKLKVLQAQMQPHFLMNALNAISSLVYSNPAAADEMIARLGLFLRRLLSQEQSAQVTLEQEIESVQSYVDIMQMRYEDRLKYRCQIDPAVSAARIPSLSLQPLVENSILHGVNPVDFSVEIDVVARSRGDQVEVSVRDRGKGIQPGAQPGVGLQNLRSRLAAVYGERQTVEVRAAEGGGTVVTLLIPQNG